MKEEEAKEKVSNNAEHIDENNNEESTKTKESQPSFAKDIENTKKDIKFIIAFCFTLIKNLIKKVPILALFAIKLRNYIKPKQNK